MKLYRKAKLFVSVLTNKDTRSHVGWIVIKDDGDHYYILKQSILSRIRSGTKHYLLELSEFDKYVELQEDGSYLIYFQPLDGASLEYWRVYIEERKKRMDLDKTIEEAIKKTSQMGTKLKDLNTMIKEGSKND